MVLCFFRKLIRVLKKLLFSHGSAQSREVLIAFKKGLNVKILNEYFDDNGGILALKCKIWDHSFSSKF